MAGSRISTGGGFLGIGTFLNGAPCTVPYPMIGALSNYAPGSTTLTRYYRVFGSGTISKIGMHITTSAGNIYVATYSNSGLGRSAAPSSRTATSAQTASPGTGYQEVALTASVFVRDGDWFALFNDDATFALEATRTGDGTSGLAQGFNGYQTVSAPPATPSVTSTAALAVPYMIGVP